MSKTKDYVFKILLIGDPFVGKTQIMSRFSEDAFRRTHIATRAIDVKIKSIKIDGKLDELQIWDRGDYDWFEPGALEIHPRVRDEYYKGAKGIMLIYDICNTKSFHHIKNHIADLEQHFLIQHAPRDVEIMLLGNKCDREDKRQVSKYTGQRFAAEHGMTFMEVSACANINIQESFFTLARQIMSKGELRALSKPEPFPALVLRTGTRQIMPKEEDATGSDECTEEDGSDEIRTRNACVVQ